MNRTVVPRWQANEIESNDWCWIESIAYLGRLINRFRVQPWIRLRAQSPPSGNRYEISTKYWHYILWALALWDPFVLRKCDLHKRNHCIVDAMLRPHFVRTASQNQLTTIRCLWLGNYACTVAQHTDHLPAWGMPQCRMHSAQTFQFTAPLHKVHVQ